jgi:hypothetical protein
MKSDLIAIIDTLLDDPTCEPDLAAIKTIAATTHAPITLMAEVVRLMWLCAERPSEFDAAVMDLYDE